MTMSPLVPDNDRPPPARFALDRWTWKEIGYLLANLPMALAGFVYTVFMIGVGVGLAVTVIGLPLLAAGLHGARLIGRAERGRARAMLGLRIDEPSPMVLSRQAQGFFPGCGRASRTRWAGGRCCTPSSGCPGACSPSP